jgi:REP element-mobilizing transposase RayT
MSRDRYKIFENRYPHFLTSTVVNWLPIFGNPSIAQIVLDSLQFLQQHERLTVYAYIILENHLHLIASADNLSKEIANFRSYTARQIIDFYKAQNVQHILKQLNYYKLRHKTDRDYQLWQEGTHPEQIQGKAMMRQKIEYIHYNPVKRGYVDEPTHWRYSSARNYVGQKGLLEVQTEW